MNRNHQPPAKEIVRATRLRSGHKLAHFERLRAVARLVRPFQRRVPAIGRKAQAKFVRQRLGKIAALQVGPRRFRGRIDLEQLVPPRCDRRVERVQFLALAARLWIARPAFGNDDARALREAPDCFGKRQVLHQHEKFENVAAVTAAEALENLPRRIDVKRRRLFLVKRRERLEFRARLFQRHIAAHHVNDVRRMAYLLDDFGRDHAGHGIEVAYVESPANPSTSK